jgi:hypothetical protein
MLDKIKNLFTKKVETPKIIEPIPEIKTEVKPKKPRSPRKPKAVNKEPTLTPKQLATQNNEPYINIVSVEIDPSNVNDGSFELDWNDKFVLNLIKAGYKIREDDDERKIVDRWFQTVCRNIALEIYEQEVADPSKRNDDIRRVIKTKDIGDGRTEVS